MKLDINELPKKLNDICYFQKCNDGCKIYSYAENVGARNEVMIIALKDFQIEKDFCVDSKALEMAKLLYPCDIEVTSNSFIIKSQKGKYTAKLREENLFDIKIGDDIKNIETSLNTLTKACEYTAKENSKKIILTGVHIDNNGNVYSTDSFKMFYDKKGDFVEEGITLMPSFIKNVKDLSEKDKITLFYNKLNVIFRKDNIIYISRLIEGSYPKVNTILNNINSSEIFEIDKKKLQESLDIANNVGNPKGKDVKPLVIITKNKLEVLGDNSFEAEIDFNNEDRFKLAIAKDNLDQSLKVFDGDIRFNIVYGDKMGKMLFITSPEKTQIVLILCVKI